MSTGLTTPAERSIYPTGVMSPWGHPVQTLDEPRSAIETLEATYDLKFVDLPRYNFLRRAKEDRATDLGFDFETDLLSEAEASAKSNRQAYVPERDDPFVYGSSVQYHKTLKLIKRHTNEIYDSLNDYANTVTGNEEFQGDADLGENRETFELRQKLHPGDKKLFSVILSESTILRKFTTQRMRPPYWYINKFTPNKAEIADSELEAHVEWFFDQVLTNDKEDDFSKAKRAVNDIDAMSDPLDTNSGVPLIAAGPENRLNNLMLYFGSCCDGDEVLNQTPFVRLGDSNFHLPKPLAERMELLAEDLSLPVELFAACVCNSRTGPSRKGTPLWRQEEDDLVADSEVMNLTRARNVYMAPALINMLTAPVTQLLVHIRKSITGAYYDSSFETILETWKLNHRLHDGFETDFSGMDQTFAIKLRLAIFKQLMKRYSHIVPEWKIKLAAYHPWMPYLIPDFTSAAGMTEAILCLPNDEGAGLFSGLKFTSSIDSIGALIFITLGLRRANLLHHYEGSLRGADSAIFVGNQGDDLILFYDETIVKSTDLIGIYDILEKAAEDLGFSVTIVAGNRFLMQHKFGRGPRTPLLSRIIQQTLSNEHNRSDASIFKLGCYSRTMGMSETIALLEGTHEATRDASTALKEAGRKIVTAFYAILESTRIHTLFSAGDGTDPFSSDSTDDERLMNIRELGIKINADKSRRQSLVKLLSLDRYSSSTEHLQLLLEEEIPGLAELAEETDLKERKLFTFIMNGLYTPFSREALASTIAETSDKLWAA